MAQQTNPTNNKELQDKIKQAQQQLDKLTPEQKKMMEQMGMSTNLPSNQQMYADELIGLAVGGDGVPKKNLSLINAIYVCIRCTCQIMKVTIADP